MAPLTTQAPYTAPRSTPTGVRRSPSHRRPSSAALQLQRPGARQRRQGHRRRRAAAQATTTWPRSASPSTRTPATGAAATKRPVGDLPAATWRTRCTSFLFLAALAGQLLGNCGLQFGVAGSEEWRLPAVKGLLGECGEPRRTTTKRASTVHSGTAKDFIAGLWAASAAQSDAAVPRLSTSAGEREDMRHDVPRALAAAFYGGCER